MDNGLMKAIRGMFPETFGEKLQAQDDKQKLLELVRQAKDELNNADRGFDEAADKDIAEYYIYYRKASEERYNYLIKAVKNKMGVNEFQLAQCKLPSDLGGGGKGYSRNIR